MAAAKSIANTELQVGRYERALEAIEKMDRDAPQFRDQVWHIAYTALEDVRGSNDSSMSWRDASKPGTAGCSTPEAHG